MDEDKMEIYVLENALIEMIAEGLNNYHLLPNSHRQTSREYYREEINIIERTRCETWDEIIEAKNGK